MPYRALASLSLAALLVLASAPAQAEEDEPVAARGVQVGVGSGVFFVPRYEGPFASADVQASVPVAIDVGVFVSRNIELGGFGQIAAVLTPRDHDPPYGHADGLDARFGGTLRYHAAPRARFDPWVGFSLGVETFSMDRGDVKGVGVLGLALAGFDWRVTDHFAFGPQIGGGPTVGSSTWILHTHGGDLSTASAFGMLSGSLGARAIVSF